MARVSKALLEAQAKLCAAILAGTQLQRCIRFCRAMHWHLQFTPEAQSFRAVSYNNAADALAAHGTLTGLTTIPGIGPSMRKHFADIQNNKVPDVLLALAENGPPFTVSELTRIPNVGPKTALKLYEVYNVTSLKDVEARIKSQEITDPKLIQGFYDMSAVNDRIPRKLVLDNIDSILKSIKEITERILAQEQAARDPELCDTPAYRGRVIIVGSTRRFRPDIRDIDLLVEVPEKQSQVVEPVLKELRKIAPVNLNNKDGHKKAEIQIEIGGRKRKLDVNFMPTVHWGTAVLHFTGPVEYNRAVRKYANQHGMSVSQYSVTVKGKNGKRDSILYFPTEKKVLAFLKLPYLKPELRDNVMDITVPAKGLVKDVLADLHIHTVESDGLSTMQDMITAAKKLDLVLIGFSNHSKRTGHGIAEPALTDMLPGLRRSFAKDSVLFGAEVDILDNGDLDYSDALLKKLDYAIVSIHTRIGFNTTERYVHAIKTLQRLHIPGIIAHITGRIIGQRPGADADYNAVFEAAARAGVAIEINGQYDRCDASDALLVKARKCGCVFALSSDFHGKTPAKTWDALLENAVMLARRGWIPRKSVINAHPKTFSSWLRPVRKEETNA